MKLAIAILVATGCRPAPPRPETSDVHIDIPKLRIAPTAFGVPITGDVELEAHVSAPPQDLRKANGTLSITCSACELGATSLPTFGGPIPLARLGLGRIEAVIDVAGGLATVRRFSVTSPDLEIDIRGRVDLYTNQLAGCIRYRPTDTLQQREPRTFDALSLLGAALGEDRWYHITVDGTLAAPRLMGRVCAP